MGDTVPHFAVSIAWVLGIASIAAFLFLIDYTARLLRPISIVRLIAEQGIKAIEFVYPDPIEVPRVIERRHTAGVAARVIEHQGSSAIVLLRSLVSMAQGADGVVELVPRVGDFVAKGDPLFRLHGGANWIGEKRLRAQVAFGSERTIDQDPAFAFRVIVDVAIKALSAAINDPTTAVLALDQLHRLLRQVGRRHLHDDAIFDSKAALRLIFATPDWEDFVQLTFSEIRLYGAANFQIARRVRAMIDDLVKTLPESRQPALRDELDVLDRMLERLHHLPEDLALAREPDLQGLGGALRRQ